MAVRNVILMDLDGTLIKTKSKKLFPIDVDDWKLNAPVVKFIKNYIKPLSNPLLIIVTNQSGISRGHVTEEEINHKIDNIVKELPFKVSYSIVADSYTSEFRKPKTKGILKFLRDEGVTGFTEDSCMFGDSGGRVSSTGKKLDFSNSDLKFAEYLKIKFIHANDC